MAWQRIACYIGRVSTLPELSTEAADLIAGGVEPIAAIEQAITDAGVSPAQGNRARLFFLAFYARIERAHIDGV